MVLPQLKLGNSPPVFSGAKENFSRLLPSVRDEMMPQLMKEQPGKNHGKTMEKPWKNHGKTNTERGTPTRKISKATLKASKASNSER